MNKLQQEKITLYLNFVLFIFFLLFFNGLIYHYYSTCKSQTGGSFIYILDDTYIHLAMAKNFALYGNWGVVYDEFCSTSSSPLYTSLISICIKVFGDNPLYPLILNTLLANCIATLFYIWFRKNVLALLFCYLCLLCPVLLHIQVLNGMEHTLHIFLIILNLSIFIQYTRTNFTNKPYKYLFLFTLGLLCITRYESMFYISSLILVLILFKQYKLALVALFIGFLPIVLFGIYSISNGGYFFPNSLLIKGKINVSNGMKHLIMQYWKQIYNNWNICFIYIPMLLLGIIVISDYIKEKYYTKNIIIFLRKNYVVLIVFTTLFLHSLFADFGWGYRYEAYLYALLYFVLADIVSQKILISRESHRYAVTIIFISFVFILLFMMKDIKTRLTDANTIITKGSKNIFDQQIQMSTFLQKYYTNPKVIACDIGALCYFNKLKLLDLIGLGSNNILKEKIKNNTQFDYKTGTIIDNVPYLNDPQYKEYNIIIIYDYVLGIKSEKDYEKLNWIKVAEMTIQDRVVCPSDKVTFYSNDSTEAIKLKQNLFLFKQDIPKDVSLNIMD